MADAKNPAALLQQKNIELTRMVQELQRRAAIQKENMTELQAALRQKEQALQMLQGMMEEQIKEIRQEVIRTIIVDEPETPGKEFCRMLIPADCSGSTLDAGNSRQAGRPALPNETRCRSCLMKRST